MRRLPLFLMAGVAAVLVVAAIAVMVNGPDPAGAGRPAEQAAADDPNAIGSVGGGQSGAPGEPRGTDYWTPERMGAAKPLPTPKISDEEYQRLFGKKKSD
jgi:hypothetical protein